MALMSIAKYNEFNLRELIWFFRKNSLTKLDTNNERTKPVIVQKCEDLGITEAAFIAFWTRDDIRSHPQNLWNQSGFKSSKGITELYADFDAEMEEEGGDSEEEQDARANDEADDGKDASDEEDGREEPEDQEEPIYAAEVDDEEEGKELEEDPESLPSAQASAIAPSTAVANFSNSNGTTSTQHASTNPIPAQTNSPPMGPLETPEYTRLKESVDDLIAQVVDKGAAKVLSDLQGLNQG
jgi:hypothetical protein